MGGRYARVLVGSTLVVVMGCGSGERAADSPAPIATESAASAASTTSPAPIATAGAPPQTGRTLPAELPALANEAKVVWAKRFDVVEDPSAQPPPADALPDEPLRDLELVVDARGASYLAWCLRGRMTLARPVRSTATSVVVSKLGSDGTPAWVTLLPNGNPTLKQPAIGWPEPTVTAITLAAAGQVVVSGMDFGQLQLGVPAKSSSTSVHQPWLTWLDGDSGKHAGAARPTDAHTYRVAGVHASSDDQFWLAGDVEGGFGGYVGVMFPVDRNGKVGPSKTLLAGRDLLAERIRPLPGNDYMFSGTLFDFDQTSQAAVGVAHADRAKSLPEVRWLRALPTGRGDVDSKGRVVFAGRFAGSRGDISLDGGEIVEPKLPKPDDPVGVLVLRLGQKQGAVIDARLISTNHPELDVTALAVHRADSTVAFAGELPPGATIDFGHGAIHGGNGPGGFIAALNDRLQPIASMPLRGGSKLRVLGLAPTADGHVIVTGIVSGDLVVGDVRLLGEGLALYVVKIALT